MWQLGGKCCPFFVWFSNILIFLQTHFSSPKPIRMKKKLPHFITLHGLANNDTNSSTNVQSTMKGLVFCQYFLRNVFRRLKRLFFCFSWFSCFFLPQNRQLIQAQAGYGGYLSSKYSVSRPGIPEDFCCYEECST